MSATMGAAAGDGDVGDGPGAADGVNVGSGERILTGLAGGLLVAVGGGLGRGWGIAAAGLGGLLLGRAVTGYCPIYGRRGGGRQSPRPGSAALQMARPPPRPAPGAPVAEVLGGPQPSPRGAQWRDPEGGPEGAKVSEASEQSFPASDPPAFSQPRAGRDEVTRD